MLVFLESLVMEVKLELERFNVLFFFVLKFDFELFRLLGFWREFLFIML